MADKQISQLTEVSTPATTDLYVCQQSSTAKKITLDAIRSFIQKFTNALTVSTINDTDYIHLNTSSGTNRKVTASDLKTYCGSGGGGSGGAFYATYGTTTLSQVIAAYNNGKSVYLKAGVNIIPLSQTDLSNYCQFYNVQSTTTYEVNSSGWSTQ